MTPPILVVGAGPVGLTLAMELARFGMPVRIIDKTAARTDKSKALAIWPRTLELLERSDCATAFAAAGLHTRAVNILAGKRTIAHVLLDGIESAYPYVLMLPQSETERVLETRLESLGVRVERETTLTAFAQDADRVTCQLEGAGGRTETVEAHWLAGCDGARSTVRHGLGLGFEGVTMASRFVLADVEVTGLTVAKTDLAICWHAMGLLVFFPIGSGRYRIIADAGAGDGVARDEPTLAEVQALVDQRGPGGVVLSNPVWLSSFTVNERMVDSFRHGRVFVAGDAAHIHSPAGGQGMNTGMQDAFNLAWKLVLAARDDHAAPALLDSYGVERSAVAARVLEDSGRLLRVALAAGPVAQHLRNFVAHHIFGLSAVRHAMANRLSELDVGYPESPLTAAGARDLRGPSPGARIVAGAPFGAGDSPRFAVLATPGEDLARVFGRHASLVEPSLRAPVDPDGIWLVRPDGYVAAVARRSESTAIDDYLRTLHAVPA